MGIAHFYEPGLDESLKKLVNENFLHTISEIKDFLVMDTIFICVGTPSNTDDSINLSYLEQVFILISKYLRESRKYLTLIIKSTVVPSTTDTYLKNST